MLAVFGLVMETRPKSCPESVRGGSTAELEMWLRKESRGREQESVEWQGEARVKHQIHMFKSGYNCQKSIKMSWTAPIRSRRDVKDTQMLVDSCQKCLTEVKCPEDIYLTIRITVRIFLTQQTLSYFQKTCNKSMQEPKRMIVFVTKTCFSTIQSWKIKGFTGRSKLVWSLNG